MTVGIVVVSHSPALAKAAVDLALEMVPAGPPPVAVAAGGPGGVTGTDAVAVSEAIARVGSPDGVLVLMDLGSAVLSAEMALEFVDDPGVPVRLTSAPFVEGLLAAVVSAAGGASLGAVEHEASTSKIGEDQIFYCKQRGLSAEDAVNLIVNGFCKEVFRELPMEFAVEAQKLLGVSLEGSVG